MIRQKEEAREDDAAATRPPFDRTTCSVSIVFGRLPCYVAGTAMAESAYLPGLAVRDAKVLDVPRHSALVRITHWIHAISFIALVVSGIGILLAHPRFYWGETGSIETPSLFDLPLPFMIGGPSGWGRYLHFQSAWLCVLTGLLYVVSGLFTRHFYKNLVPGKKDLSWSSIWRVMSNHLRLKRPGVEEAQSYNVLQRISYLSVVFLVTPLMIWTGMAMSPAITSVFPFFVTSLGGHQTARTLHFFAAVFLVLFLVVHIAMVIFAGFTQRMKAMIFSQASQAGPRAAGKERA
jgi:thiosulfate reductase cytochrome b subunit